MYVTLRKAEGGCVECAGLCGLPPKRERHENQPALGCAALCQEPGGKPSWKMRREEKGGGEGRVEKGVWHVCMWKGGSVGSEVSVMAQPWVLFCRFLA